MLVYDNNSRLASAAWESSVAFFCYFGIRPKSSRGRGHGWHVDIWIQRRRAAQVIRPFLRRYGRLQLAHILLEEDPAIAGKIAAEEYERLLNIASRRL